MAPSSFDQFKSQRVRELCRRLKPIIGPQAEKIYLAFVAESESGKAQIHDYLELLAAQHFQGDLDAEGPGLLPPGQLDADGEFSLGQVVYNDRPLYPFGLRENEWTQHIGIFGRSGSGKTNFGYWVLQRLLEQNKPVLVIDWKRSWRDLVALPAFANIAIYTIGRPVAPLSFNPLVPPPGTNPKTWLKKLIGVIAHAYTLGEGVAYLLQEALDQVYEDAGVYAGSVQRWPSFRDVLSALKQRQTSGREAGWMTSALRALASLCFGEMDVLVNQGSDDLEALLNRTVILELDALTQADKVFFSSVILLWIHHHRMTEPDREIFKHAIILEEAHHLMEEKSSFLGGESILETTFREVRELGQAMIVLDQHPSQIPVPVLGNAYAAICFNLKHRSDVSAISQAMLLQDEEKDVLGNLQVGQAVVRLQGRSARPFMIAVEEFPINKGAITDAKVMQHMTDLGLLSVRQQIQQEVFVHTHAVDERMPQQASPEPSPAPVDASMLFLFDVRQYPNSGIAQRYHRLGLSVRQGQKLKQHLVQQGLLFEQVELTSRGKLRAVRLTEQGELAVQRMDPAQQKHQEEEKAA